MEKKAKIELMIEQLEERIAPGKGNNGWGNGAEGTNAGSDDGATADSKLPESGTQNQHTER
jgi:hypothetical protein